MNDLNIDVDLAAKTKFNELLVELNDIISKKWLVLTNNGLNSLNDISNLFQKLFCEDEEENNCDLLTDLQSINNHFEEIKKILESFKSLLDKLKLIESRLFNIFSFDFIQTEEFLFDKIFVKNLINSYKKELLVNQYLSQNRNNREELVAITCYWMHEPCLDQMLISQLKFLINYFKINS
jgi:hypothetical protein